MHLELEPNSAEKLEMGIRDRPCVRNPNDRIDEGDPTMDKRYLAHRLAHVAC
jgi:hypothetical protein